ncbi:MAG TPA: helix-hairpin-helix domain-containing protein [Candidatus Nanoarchaeia archaeon]|nr:helix-hairpin-helix domain-containing protein [Candidatus Nanoarchaeia archaeon]
MDNHSMVKVLYAIADLLDVQGVAWKPQAYRKAARTIEGVSEDISLLYQQGKLYELEGIGEHIGKKIEELLITGKLKYYEELKKKVGIDVEKLNEIPNLGPKRIKILYEKLKIRDVKDLEQAIKQKKLQDLPGFSEETEKNLLQGIQLMKTKPQRFLRKDVVPIAKKITGILKAMPWVERVDVAGSFRRKKETVGDLDILVMSSHPLLVMNAFTSLPKIVKVLAKGQTKSSIRLESGLQVDLRVVGKKEYGAALLYFTGSKDHNVYLRKIALQKGFTLNEYALTSLKDRSWIAGRTEKEIYQKLGLKYLAPEKRD